MKYIFKLTEEEFKKEWGLSNRLNMYGGNNTMGVFYHEVREEYEDYVYQLCKKYGVEFGTIYENTEFGKLVGKQVPHIEGMGIFDGQKTDFSASERIAIQKKELVSASPTNEGKTIVRLSDGRTEVLEHPFKEFLFMLSTI